MTRGRALGPEVIEQQVAVAENGGEKIIEVVRHPAGELSECFHFLRTAELILHLLARGDVHERTHEAHRGLVVVAHDQRALK